MKRFWATASVVETAGGYAVQLDGRMMRLPEGLHLIVPQPALAEAIAAEWREAGGGPGNEMSFDEVPLTRLAGTAIHRIAPDPAPTAAALAQYANSDLLCYRASHPPALTARQAHAWQPWIDWAAARFGARLRVTEGLMPVPQPAEACAKLAAAVNALSSWQLAALGVLVPAYGSLVLGLAVGAGALAAEEAFGLSALDESFQEEAWGRDSEAEARRAGLARSVAEAGRFLALAR